MGHYHSTSMRNSWTSNKARLILDNKNMYKAGQFVDMLYTIDCSLDSRSLCLAYDLSLDPRLQSFKRQAAILDDEIRHFNCTLHLIHKYGFRCAKCKVLFEAQREINYIERFKLVFAFVNHVFRECV